MIRMTYDSTLNGEFRRNNNSQNNGKRCSYKLSKEIRQRHRVQWIDECQQLPLVSEHKHRFLQPSKSEPKSILKSTVNCLIIVSEWIMLSSIVYKVNKQKGKARIDRSIMIRRTYSHKIFRWWQTSVYWRSG